MTLITSEGILLRSYEYSESSRIFRFLTPDLGMVSLIGRGVRKRGAMGEGSTQTFGEASLTFSYRPNRELHTIRELQPRGSSLALGRGIRRFAGASLVAELLLSHSLEGGDRALYDWVRAVLARLASVPEREVVPWTLSGGWKTLALLGFPPGLERCVRCDRALPEAETRDGEPIHRFDVAAGGIVCSDCGPQAKLPRIGPGSRRDLLMLVHGDPPADLRGERAHLSLLEGFAQHHLGLTQGPRSFSTLRALLNKTESSGYEKN